MEPLTRREPKPLIETTILLMGNEPMCYKVKLKNRIVAVANRVILDDIEDGIDVYDCWQQMFMIEKMEVMENLRRVKLTSPLDVCVVDINMVYYALAYGGVPYFEAPLSTIEPFENLYPDDDSTNYITSHYKLWKL